MNYPIIARRMSGSLDTPLAFFTRIWEGSMALKVSREVFRVLTNPKCPSRSFGGQVEALYGDRKAENTICEYVRQIGYSLSEVRRCSRSDEQAHEDAAFGQCVKAN